MSASMATEAGKLAFESFGGAVRRVFGREVPAPRGAEERAALAAQLVELAGQEPERARALAAWLATQGAAPGLAHRVPALLPPSARFFTDRADQLAALQKEAARKADGRTRLAVLAGPELIGTTALALYFGHREAARFPDGQLYVDLRGGSVGSAPEPATVLRYFLSRLGVPDEEIPPGPADRTDLYRTLLADRRLLVVLDHAQSAAQVLPLITTAPGVFTVVVARRPLTGLDAVRVPVGPLPEKDAKRLLIDLAGKQAVTAARAALPSVLARCAGSPFALQAAAQRLTTGLAPRGGAGAADPVADAIEDLYQDLDTEAAALYRLCALRPWPAISADSAAVVAGTGAGEAARLLAELADRGLLEQTAAGRYRYRPAVRRHAEAAAARVDGKAACDAATAELVGWYLRFAVRHDYAALSGRWQLGPLYAPYREQGPAPDEGVGRALAALGEEIGNLLEAVRTAEGLGEPDFVCQLVEALWAWQLKVGRADVLLPALRAGARAASQLRGLDPRMAGRMHTQLALGLMDFQHYEEAEVELIAAAEAERTVGHLRGRATAVETLGLLRLRQWRFQPALDCFEEAGRILDGIREGEVGFADLPRARALLERHRGRALRGLGESARAVELLTRALEFFEDGGGRERYNAARVMSDLAETHLLAGRPADALALIDRAAAILTLEKARAHLITLDGLRLRCLAAGQQ
ncbi:MULTISPECIES: tetratricopeptide repeat protein [unclassified Kitasatospora]|uniref:tetratricopeptide repeat protein n=1 Tax=unclassified Kitasatospora TaxID=2633591 RepID=UPI002474E742|nr:tetratricopeptide repeat protein [Kitasatospora sp. MAP12-44]